MVYRISHINPDGAEIDLSWKQLKARCNELNVQFVPEIWDGKLINYLKNRTLPTIDGVEGLNHESFTWRQWFEAHLKQEYLDKPSRMDKNVIEEGICLRKEQYPRPKIYKVKSPLFYIHEGVLMDKAIPDIEEEN